MDWLRSTAAAVTVLWFVYVSGTTWLQAIITQIVKDDARFQFNRKDKIDEIYPFFEYPFRDMDDIRRRPSPRLIKTHLPYAFLPSGVARGNGKVDVVVTWCIGLASPFRFDQYYLHRDCCKNNILRQSTIILHFTV